MNKESARTALLEIGTQILLEKGYHNAGIQEIVQAADVPKGSFYYYFKSKEDFGLEIIEHFAQTYNASLEVFLADKTLSPLSRLRKHAQYYCDQLETLQCRNGCLMANLGQELADQSETLRSRIAEVLAQWRKRYAACFKQAQEAGEIPKHLNVEVIAEFYLSAWEGAVLQVKVMRNVEPFKRFIQVMFEEVLKQ